MKLLGYCCLFVLAVLTAGCSHRGFMKDGATQQEFYRDLQTCNRETAPSWKYCSGSACMHQDREIKGQRNLCMQVKGWRITREKGRFME